MTEYQVPIKFKYRDPANRPVRKNGSYKSRASPAKTGAKPQGTGHRRRQGLGATGRGGE